MIEEESHAEKVPVGREILQGVVFLALAFFGVFQSCSVVLQTNGDWSALVGGGGRGPAVPMFVTVFIWAFLALIGVAVVLACVVSLVRAIRAHHV
ncbi:hypothetical protein KIV56_12555 [Cryobacterium breve]|uniref:Uncharacterized protein n=1 Tax=Cryobacterium breve TaxID=1259258 RepID=A0ABY7NCL1_9MICO|nr:hypothetical protein [Cryobacterium breve]WBM79274.1 hypothetical protein KIV56_12555 [Cryobacterium breve]